MKKFNSCLYIVTCLLFLSGLISCTETATPKPKGYYRIDLPQKKYSLYDPPECPYAFELPSYATVLNYHDSIQQPCWKYIRFTQFNAELFLSYKKVDKNIGVFLEDARTLAYKHTVRADAIDETVVETPNHVYGIIYDIGGKAASSVQFYATDSTKNFIRGALYFNMPPQPDSLAPIIAFLRVDILKMMTSLKWKSN